MALAVQILTSFPQLFFLRAEKSGRVSFRLEPRVDVLPDLSGGWVAWVVGGGVGGVGGVGRGGAARVAKARYKW